MPNAVAEMEVHHEIGALTGHQRAAVLLSMVGPRTRNLILNRLTCEECGELLLETALLPPVTRAARRRILREFRTRLGKGGAVGLWRKSRPG